MTSTIWLEDRRGQDALGIDESAPLISWTPPSGSGRFALEFAGDHGTEQALADDGDLVPWPFAPLGPRDAGTLRVRVEGSGVAVGALRIERGLGDAWEVDFASPSVSAPPGSPRPGYLMRAEVSLAASGIRSADVSRARLYITAHGIYEPEWNGRRLGDEHLAPGWSSYRHRLRYRTYDLTDSLEETNALGVWLADGWYRGHLGFDGGLWDVYGTDVAVLAQLEVRTYDGRVRRLPLDWVWSESPVRAAGLYEGESFDARMLPAGWSAPGFDASLWTPARMLPRADFGAAIEAPTGQPVRRIEELAPAHVERLDSGRVRLDFGQNISGVLRIRPREAAGSVITLHHAEVLENGALGVRPLRAATSIDTYVCAGTPGEEWMPRFTIHGFRYAEIEGWSGLPAADDVVAVVMHTDMVRTGWFECSDPRLNQLHSNVVWSMRDNFVDLPTDCPQRDERMGWTGDIQVFAPTALTLYAAHGTLRGWLRDLAAEQAVRGHVPCFVPWVECGFPDHPIAAWGDAAVIVPWELYLSDGDVSVLADQYASMRAWVDLVDGLTGGTGLWSTGFQLGDWLDPAAPPDRPGQSQTDKALVATAYHVRTARILAETAALLGRPADAARYAEIARRATAAFQCEFVSPSGRVVSDTATSLAVCLMFDLLPSVAAQERAGARLIELVRAGGHRITTGFVGTPIICDALVRAGATEDAYRLLLQDQAPSWLYQVSMGATTIWERWDSMLPDGSINPGDMTSFNHYALGAVAGFLHRVVAGLRPDAPGWRRIRVEPRPGGGLTRASARYETPRGPATAGWRLAGELFELEVTIPPGAMGVIVLPGDDAEAEVGPGTHRFQAVLAHDRVPAPSGA